jgi:ribosomal protein L7/L12
MSPEPRRACSITSVPNVRFTAWRPGTQKVALNDAIRLHSGVGLADAKRIVDDLLDGKTPSVAVPTQTAADALVAAAEAVGADATVEPGP